LLFGRGPPAAKSNTNPFQHMRIAKQLAHTTIGVVFCVLAGALWGFLIDISPGFGPRLTPLLPMIAIAYGAAVGDTLTRATGSPRAFRLETIIVVGLVAGAVGGRFIVGWLALTPNCAQHLKCDHFRVLVTIVLSPFLLITLAAAICGAIGRIRILKKRALAVKH